MSYHPNKYPNNQLQTQPPSYQSYPPPAQQSYVQTPPPYQAQGYYPPPFQPQNYYNRQPLQAVPAPATRKGFPWWGWLIIALVVLIAARAVVGLSARNSALDTYNQIIFVTGGSSGRPAQPGASSLPLPASGGVIALPSSNNQAAKIGQTVSKNGYIITVHGVERSKNFSDLKDYKAPLQPGYTLLAVDITLECAREKCAASSKFGGVMNNRHNYDPAFFAIKKPEFKTKGDLTRGGKVRGWLTYEVDETATGLVFEYHPTPFTEAINFEFMLDK